MGISALIQSFRTFGLALSSKRCAIDDSLGSRVTADEERDAREDKKPADGMDEAIGVSL